MNGWRKVFVFALLVAMLALAAPAAVFALTGAIYTTDAGCTGVNVNHFATKMDVYLDGGPQGGGSGLPDGVYYVQVTNPSGSVVLGTSVGTADPTPVTVVAGKFVQCYRLWDIVMNGADTGFADTPNAGGVYKVWVSPDAAFADQKTDNFKVTEDVTQTAWLDVLKFYDANANGINDDGQLITGWKVNIADTLAVFNQDAYTPVHMELDAGTYDVTEYLPVEPNWMPTTATAAQVTLPPDATVEFGNLCLGPGGGKTLGFWSNKNGQAMIGADDLAMLTALNLRNAAGANFDPANNAAFRTWLLSANATNMAYMLSAQLAAMELNVYNGLVNGGALIYAPGAMSANALGFATVSAVMAEANAELGLHGLALAGSPYRDYQEDLKDALDWANNNMTFVQPTPCPFTFPQ